jgi:hypothetical protein
MVWRCTLAITNTGSMPGHCILYRKPLDDNIYKHLQLGWVMVIRLVIDFEKLVQVALKKGR